MLVGPEENCAEAFERSSLDDNSTTLFPPIGFDPSIGSGMLPSPEEEEEEEGELTQKPPETQRPVGDLEESQPTAMNDPQSEPPEPKGSDVVPEGKTNTSRGFCWQDNKIISGL